MGSSARETGGRSPGVSFFWQPEDASKGEMTATFDTNGEAYTGNFLITSDTRVDDGASLWPAWHGRWSAWPRWDADPELSTGRVLANLTNWSGDQMRCNFRLVRPASGMAGGGRGKCQLTTGRTIDATFPAA
jgi:hypothetical protein